jgi:electron-transferring-flavoprotein dehydrogenase
MSHEQIEFDVLFVGGGPACLAGAIHLMQTAKAKGIELEVALIEKGADIGSHAVSGAILNPRALAELIPDYLEKGCPIEATVKEDAFYYLTEQSAFRLPVTPRQMRNHGYHIISMSKFARWLGGICEEQGINLFPGFAGKKLLFSDDGRKVIGVRTGEKGLNKEGKPKGNFEPAIDLLAKVTVLGEGARGSLVKEAAEPLGLYSAKMPPVYETGIKEVMQLPEGNAFTGSTVNDIHFMGYPLGFNTPGGGFIYAMKDNQIAIGYLTALGYEDPLLDPYEEFIRFKQHPFVAGIIRDGKVIEQGARTVSTGGYYSIPRLAVSGALLVGNGASIFNTAGLKGIHLAMKSGMLAAEAILSAHAKDDYSEATLALYAQKFEESWVKKEIYESRNVAQALAKKGLMKLIHLGAQYVTQGRGVRDPLPLKEDHRCLKPLKGQAEPGRPGLKLPYDGATYVDKLTGVYLSKTQHREDQPSHLIVHDTHLCVTRCYDTFRSPCTRFCPGNVYEMEVDEKSGQRRLKLNPSNCFHCKTCDIKDPYQNITWTCPEGGEGPGYSVA